MENTRHERAIIMVATYTIGFVSAYIAFGVGLDQNSLAVDTTALSPSSLDQAIKHAGIHEAAATIVADKEGLSLSTRDGDKLLSVSKQILKEEGMDVSKPTPGIFEVIIDAELSRDSRFAYFCEQLQEGDQTCNPYVYSVEQDVLFPLKLNGDAFRPDIVTYKATWTEDGLLNVNGHISVSSETPWVLK